jgi:transcriptional regulator with XRE-family HTH domain
MNRLKKQRRLLGMTQHEMARAAGIAPGRLIWAETARVKLTSDELQRIKDALAQRALEVNAALAAA